MAIAEEEVFKRLEVLYQSFSEVDYIGEPVSIHEHSLQAGYFAKRVKEHSKFEPC